MIDPYEGEKSNDKHRPSLVSSPTYISLGEGRKEHQQMKVTIDRTELLRDLRWYLRQRYSFWDVRRITNALLRRIRKYTVKEE